VKTLQALVAVSVILATHNAWAVCERQEQTLVATRLNLYDSRAHGGTCQEDFRKPETNDACTAFRQAMDALDKCRKHEDERAAHQYERERKAAEDAMNKRIEDRHARIRRAWQDFTSTLQIGMTAGQAFAADTEALHSPGGWGHTVNTTVNALGTDEQWVYRFSDYPVNPVYLYFRNGILVTVQK
jgi:hypothetical protein